MKNFKDNMLIVNAMVSLICNLREISSQEKLSLGSFVVALDKYLLSLQNVSKGFKPFSNNIF